MSWQHLSISAISQLLLTSFLPNFKRRLLRTSRTDSTCYVDICPGNICPGDICPYQIYFEPSQKFLDSKFLHPNLFWTNFYPKIFWLHFFGPIFLDLFFYPIFLIFNFLDLFWGPKNVEFQKTWIKNKLRQKRFKFTKWKLGSYKIFVSNKAHIDLTTTLSLTEVWHWHVIWEHLDKTLKLIFITVCTLRI